MFNCSCFVSHFLFLLSVYWLRLSGAVAVAGAVAFAGAGAGAGAFAVAVAGAGAEAAAVVIYFFHIFTSSRFLDALLVTGIISITLAINWLSTVSVILQFCGAFVPSKASCVNEQAPSQ